MGARAPGELVQLDHMSVSRDGQTLKEFRAVCPVSKIMFHRVFQSATAGNARRFLPALLAAFPWTRSIQVDDGSELMADFEHACAELAIPLFVLPPGSTKLNGCVERANGSARAEFRSTFDGELTVAQASPALASYQHFYNQHRPHMSLDWATPNEYRSSFKGLPLQSHMS